MTNHTRSANEYILARDGIVHKEAIEIIERLDREVDSILDAIDSACNALTDSIQVSGNAQESNMLWVDRLRKFISGKRAR